MTSFHAVNFMSQASDFILMSISWASSAIKIFSNCINYRFEYRFPFLMSFMQFSLNNMEIWSPDAMLKKLIEPLNDQWDTEPDESIFFVIFLLTEKAGYRADPCYKNPHIL